jgi:hypothetical protein
VKILVARDGDKDYKHAVLLASKDNQHNGDAGGLSTPSFQQNSLPEQLDSDSGPIAAPMKQSREGEHHDDVAVRSCKEMGQQKQYSADLNSKESRNIIKTMV